LYDKLLHKKAGCIDNQERGMGRRGRSIF